MDLVPNEWTQEGRLTPHTCKIRTICVGDGILTNHITSSGVLRSAAPSPADAPSRPSPMEKPADGQALRCPRCDSSNTKFCYYNNYSLSQPRHFCKACKRYWTRGGTLRNVPVGGGCRKNKRVRKSSLITSTPSNISPPAPPLSFFPSSTSMATPSTDLGFLFYNLSNSGNDLGFTALQAPYNLSLGFSSEDGYLPSLNQIPTTTPHQGYGLHQISSSFASCLLSSDEAVENRGMLGFSGINQLDGNTQIFKEVKSTMGRTEWEITSSENPVDFPLLWNNSASNALGGSMWTDSSNCGFSITPLI